MRRLKREPHVSAAITVHPSAKCAGPCWNPSYLHRTRALAIALALLSLVPSPAGARDFQATAAGILGRREGAIVVADPTSGQLKALVHPAVADSAYPPGSTFKLVTALAALETGRTGKLDCRGALKTNHSVPPGFQTHCWKPGGHGALTLEEALAHSCNVAMMQVGERVGVKTLLSTARHAGFTRLPSHHAEAQLLPLSIGEGPEVAVTPLQLAGFVGAIATGGPVQVPAWKPEMVRALPLASPEVLKHLRTGMRGSALFGSSRLAASKRLAIAGKTGTSTYLDGTNRTYGWFAGYAPVDRPRAVVVVFLKNANGFAAAAPLAKQVFEAWDQAGRP